MTVIDLAGHIGGGRGNFFAIDRRTWAKVCGSDGLGLNAAIAYLVLARGSDRTNSKTSWSVNALEQRDLLSRGRAQAAIDKLKAAKVIRQTGQGRKATRYELPPVHEIPGTGFDPRPELTRQEQEAVEMAKRGERIPKQARGEINQWYAKEAVRKGWLVDRGDGFYNFVPEPDPAPDWIWLPNELVDGAANEKPPLELMRQCQDTMLLRLFIDLYYGQNLREDGGVRRQVMYEKYDRVQVGQYGEFTVWGFRSLATTTSLVWGELTQCHRRDELTAQEKAEGKNPGVDFFGRVKQLTNLGLIDWHPVLFEGADDSAELIHALGMGRTQTIEDRLGTAAHLAGEAMLTEGHRAWVDETSLRLVPVLKHIVDVRAFGIARLRYRPRTGLTAAWWGELNEKAGSRIARYTELAARASGITIGQGRMQYQS
jgi:hypothetical protein